MAASAGSESAAPGSPPYASSADHLRDELTRIDLLVRGQVARAREVAGEDAWRGLAISEAEVDALLRRALGAPPWDAATMEPSLADAHAVAETVAEAIERRAATTPVPLRLILLAERFGLDRFALDVLLIALAPEIDLRYARLYAYLHDDVTRKRPSVDLALHLLCCSLDERFAARATFEPSAPLVRHGLVHLVTEGASQDPPPPLIARTLKVDDRVVAYLHGSDELEARLVPHARRITPRGSIAALLVDDDARARLDRLAVDFCQTDGCPVVYLLGPAGVGKRTATEGLARAAGLRVLALDSATLEGLPDEAAEAIVVAAGREAQLAEDVLLVERAELLLGAERRRAGVALVGLLARAPVPIVLAGEAPWAPSDALHERAIVRVELAPPDARARERLWSIALGGTPLAGDVDLTVIAGRLRLTGGQIHDAAATARSLARDRGSNPSPVTTADLGNACRRHASRRFGGHARRIAARPAWQDLVLPGDRVDRLREICDHARHRATVFEQWGFDRKLPNGKGLSLLFVGAPGTGKTLAASVVAGELGLDLFQIDLASVVSKWIGETEKHLARIFDEAERGNGVLFFDEADALFGKRTEIHDAHDRYANIETSYLLQRMEEYEGVVILASNYRRNLDEAFVRRLRFIVEFPIPEERERRRIWERVWPAETPRSPDLDLDYCARKFELAGAYIRNMALAAAFLAAAEGVPVGSQHVLHAARREYQKLGKMVDDAVFVPAGGRR